MCALSGRDFPEASLHCDWSEHICPDGYKYYYNCVTCESRVSPSPLLKAPFPPSWFPHHQSFPSLVQHEWQFCSGKSRRSFPSMNSNRRVFHVKNPIDLLLQRLLPVKKLVKSKQQKTRSNCVILRSASYQYRVLWSVSYSSMIYWGNKSSLQLCFLYFFLGGQLLGISLYSCRDNVAYVLFPVFVGPSLLFGSRGLSNFEFCLPAHP